MAGQPEGFGSFSRGRTKELRGGHPANRNPEALAGIVAGAGHRRSDVGGHDGAGGCHAPRLLPAVRRPRCSCAGGIRARCGTRRRAGRARYAAQLRWRDAIRPALAELLRFLDEEPALGRLCVVHSLGAVRRSCAAAPRCRQLLWKVVDRGRSEGIASRTEPPAVVAEGVVGAVLTVIQTRLLAQDSEPPDERPAIELFGSLMSLIVLPYLGDGAARRELTRPAPAPASTRRGEYPAAPGPASRTTACGSPTAPAGCLRDRPLSGCEQPRGRRARGHRRPGSDLQAAGALGECRRDRQPERGNLARRSQRVAPDRARRTRRARGRGSRGSHADGHRLGLGSSNEVGHGRRMTADRH